MRRLLIIAILGLLAAPPALGQPVAMPPSMAAPVVVAPQAAAGSPYLGPYTDASQTVVQGALAAQPYAADGQWFWQPLPQGRIYPNYLAGQRESRLAVQYFHDDDLKWITDGVLGGRVGILRYGTSDPFAPEGLQIDVEGAAFPRLNDRQLDAADFRFGFPLVYRQGFFETKFQFYHISSHLSDQLVVEGESPVLYSRDALVWGLGLRPLPALRLYGEAGYAVRQRGASQPWEFQFGVEYSPLEYNGFRGAPFAAVNAHLREEVDFGGDFVFQAGWQWRAINGQILRTGLHYLNGMSPQLQFYNRFEQELGMGVWYDF